MHFTVRWLLLGVCLFAACAQTVQAPPAALTPTPPERPILLTRAALPPTIRSQTIGPIIVRKTTNGEEAWALDRLAKAARKAGANAVTHITIRFAPSWGGWATPHGIGIAVRILEPSVEEVAQLPDVQGEWR